MQEKTLGTVYLIIGKVCSGKTTFARDISKIHRAVILSCDELLLTLHSYSTSFDFDAEIKQVKKYLFDLTTNLTNVGTNIVLDWGFWEAKERDNIDSLLSEKGIPHEWHYMLPNDNLRKEYIRTRNAKTSPIEFYIDSGLLKKCDEKFDVPTVTELKEKKVIIHDQQTSAYIPNST